MKKPKKDPFREDRIHNQAIVDAYGPEEQAMSWYYYLDDKVRFTAERLATGITGWRRTTGSDLTPALPR